MKDPVSSRFLIRNKQTNKPSHLAACSVVVIRNKNEVTEYYLSTLLTARILKISASGIRTLINYPVT